MVDRWKQTPLPYSVIRSYPSNHDDENEIDERVEFLLKHGANVDAVDYKGKTALHYAVVAKKNPLEITELLIKHKANVNAVDDESKTPLHLARENSNPCVEIFNRSWC